MTTTEPPMMEPESSAKTETTMDQTAGGIDAAVQSADNSPSRLLKEAARSLKAVEDSMAGLTAGGHRTPEEGDGGTFSKELIDIFALNLHRIEKDVHRCDRNYPYFNEHNLEKLKNVMCTYVWKHLDCGYVQGMCDLAAPLLVTFDDEVTTYGCFCKLMQRMLPNFPHGGGMDSHLANMRSLIQVMDPELFDLMQRNGDYTHFYFCYRWFLLDFKRELLYADVFLVWETIWAANRTATSHLSLFVALALLSLYRNIVLENNMDFTDIIKFFNEMAERHDAKAALQIARNLVKKLQRIIESNAR